MIGQTISHYRVLEKIGEGGMGEVYLAEDTKLGRKVALKFLPVYLQQDEVAQKRFVREAKSAAAIDHPYICKIYEAGETEVASFIAMEYLEGDTLQKKMDQGRLSLKETLHIASEIAEALEEAHKKGIVHRDLKPANVMLTPGGHIKVMDFGLAKRLQPRGKEEEITAALTKEGTTLGTLTYMSPEQLRGQEVDTRSDVFSFGVVLYEMLTGVHPFRTGTQAETINSILNEHPSNISRYTEDTSDILEHTVEKMLAKEPADRYQSVHEVRTNLRKLCEKLSVSGVLSTDLYPKFKTKPWVWMAGGVLAVLLMAFLAYFYFPDLAPSERERASSSGQIEGPLTHYEGIEFWPALSPDGRQVVFSHKAPGEPYFHLYLQILDRPERSQLTDAEANDFRPTWHPEKPEITFERWFPQNTKKGREIVTVTTLGAETLVHQSDFEGLKSRGVCYSPDGEYLAYGAREGIFLLSMKTGEHRQLTAPEPIEGYPTFDVRPRFSPDGNELAFFRKLADGSYAGVIYVLPLDQQEPLEIAKSLRIYDLEWSADGMSLVSAEGTSPSNTYFVRTSLDTGERQRLPFGERTQTFSVSAKRERLVFSSHLVWTDIWRVPGPRGEPGSPPESLVASTRLDGSPQYSPAGGKLAFVSDRSGDIQIWIADADGNNPRQLTNMGYAAGGFARWSPSGSRVLFKGQNEPPKTLLRAGGVWMIDATGGIPRQLIQGPPTPREVCWSSDEKSIYFTMNTNEVLQLWKMSIETGERVQLTHSEGPKFHPAEWNGRVYYGQSGTIFSIPESGGEPRKEFQKDPKNSYWCLWQDHIVWPGKDGKGSTVLNSFNLETRQTTQHPTSLPDESLYDPFSVSPDGRWVIYSQSKNLGSDLILVENFK